MVECIRDPVEQSDEEDNEDPVVPPVADGARRGPPPVPNPPPVQNP